MGVVQASKFLQNVIVDHMFRTTPWPKPATLYIGLYTTPPTDLGGGVEVVAGVGYARVAIASNNANWRATQGGNAGVSSGDYGATSNAITIVFPAPTAAWGNITHFGIFDAAAGGNMWIWDALMTPRLVNTGDPAPAFPIDALVVAVN